MIGTAALHMVLFMAIAQVNIIARNNALASFAIGMAIWHWMSGMILILWP
jgi:hypothetical protein